MIATTAKPHRSVGDVVALLRWSPRSIRAKTGVFLLLCALSLVTLLFAFQIPYRHTVGIGSPGDALRVSGFFDPEGKADFTYRWSQGRALVQLPLGVFPGEADVVLSGNRPGSVPPAVAFGLDARSEPLARVKSTTDFVTYPVRLPARDGVLNPAETLALSITPSDTVTPPKENRALGVAVERVVIYTNPLRFGPVIPPVLAVLLTLGMVAALALVALSIAPPLAPLVTAAYGPVLLAIGYLALRRADDPGQLAHAVIGFTVAALVAMTVVWRRTLNERPWVRSLARLDGRWLLGVALLVTLGYALYASHRMFGRLYDDTHITLRYAQNFADGKGLRFNPGERPVEGYTNFLLTVLLAGCAKVGLPLMAMAKVASVGAALGVVVATYWLTTLVLPGAPGLLRATPSLVMAGCGWFAFYAAIGLETHLFALLITVAACLVLRGRWPWAGVAFAAAYLTRPEGAGLWAVTLAWLVWQVWIAPFVARRWVRGRFHSSPPAPLHRPETEMWKEHGGDGEGRGGDLNRALRGEAIDAQTTPGPRAVLAFSLPFLAIAGLHEVWRLSYYGEPLPNTFYDKVGTAAQQVRRGADYAAHVLPQLHAVTLVALAILLVLAPSAAIASRAARYVALLTAAFVGYIALVGGDFIGPRFLFHIFPFIIVLAVAGIRSLFRASWRRAGSGESRRDERVSPLAAFAVALIAAWLFVPLLPPGTFLTQRVAGTHMREVTGLLALGEYLKETAPPGATLAIDAAGAAPFVSRLSTLDMLGLSDYHIAHSVKALGDGVPGHEKTDPAYVLAQNPTYIAVGMSKLSSGGRPGRGLDLPGFDAQYTRVALVQMTASAVSPALVLVLMPDTDVQAAIEQGYTYGLYKHR